MSESELEAPATRLTPEQMATHVAKLFKESQGAGMHIQLALALEGWTTMSLLLEGTYPTASAHDRHLLLVDSVGFLNAMILASALNDTVDPVEFLDQIRDLTLAALPHYRTLKDIILTKMSGPVGRA